MSLLPWSVVIITKPLFTANFDNRIQMVYQQPDFKSLTALVLTDDIVRSIYETPEVGASFAEPLEFSDFKGLLQASLVGIAQLNLKVTDTEPQRAARIANAWAEIVVARLNALYDVNQGFLDQIQTQMETARQNWDAAEQAVIAGTAAEPLDALSVTLRERQDSLKVYLDKVRSLDLLISDIHAMDAYLATQKQGDTLTLDSELALIGLQQRAAGGLGGVQIQVVDSNAFEPASTVARGRAKLQALAATLGSQRLELQSQVEKLVQEITATAAELEASKYRLAQLTVQRDLALSAYQALANQTVEAQITLAQNGGVVKVAGQALPPERPSGLSGALIGALAGAAGLALSVCALLIMQWWKMPQQSTRA